MMKSWLFPVIALAASTLALAPVRAKPGDAPEAATLGADAAAPAATAPAQSPAPAPPPAPAAQAPPPAAPPAPEKPPLQLVGTILGVEAKIGVLMDRTSRNMKPVHVGDDIAGWTLKSVGPHSAVVAKGANVVTLDLAKPGEAGPAGNPAILNPRQPRLPPEEPREPMSAPPAGRAQDPDGVRAQDQAMSAPQPSPSPSPSQPAASGAGGSNTPSVGGVSDPSAGDAGAASPGLGSQPSGATLATSVSGVPTLAISSYNTFGGSFVTCGYSTCGDGGGALFVPATALTRSVSSVIDLVTTSGSKLISSGTADFDLLDVGTPISGTNIPTGATISQLAEELSGPPPAIPSGGSRYAVGDTITLNDGCAVHSVLSVQLVTTTGAVLATSMDKPGECQTDPANPVSELSTSGRGSGATFTTTWWGSPTHVYMSAAATASGTGGTLNLNATAVQSPGYATDIEGNNVQLGYQALDARMFGANPHSSDSGLALATWLAAIQNTRWPSAPLDGVFWSRRQLMFAPDHGNTTSALIGNTPHGSEITFDSNYVTTSPLFHFWMPGGFQVGGDPTHGSFGATLWGIRFVGTAVNGPTLEIGDASDLDSQNNMLLYVYATNGSRDHFASAVQLNTLSVCDIGQCIVDTGVGPRLPEYIFDGVVTSGSSTLESATAAFTSADVGAEIEAGSAGPIPIGTKITAVTNSTTVTMSNNATASASGLAVNIAAGLASIIMQDNQFVNLGGQSSNGAAVGLLMRSHSGHSNVSNRIFGYMTAGNGMIGVRLADKLALNNIFYAPVFTDDFGIDAVAGAGNIVQLGRMSSSVGRYDHIPQVLLGRTVGITSQ